MAAMRTRSRGVYAATTTRVLLNHLSSTERDAERRDVLAELVRRAKDDNVRFSGSDAQTFVRRSIELYSDKKIQKRALTGLLRALEHRLNGYTSRIAGYIREQRDEYCGVGTPKKRPATPRVPPAPKRQRYSSRLRNLQQESFTSSSSATASSDDEEDNNEQMEEADRLVVEQNAATTAAARRQVIPEIAKGPHRRNVVDEQDEEEGSYSFSLDDDDDGNDSVVASSDRLLDARLVQAQQRVAELERSVQRLNRRIGVLDRGRDQQSSEIGRLNAELSIARDTIVELRLEKERVEDQLAAAHSELHILKHIDAPVNPDDIDDANAVLYVHHGWSAPRWRPGYVKKDSMVRTAIQRATKTIFGYKSEYNLVAQRRWAMFSHDTYPWATWNIVPRPLMPRTPIVDPQLLLDRPAYTVQCNGAFFVSDELYALAMMPDDEIEAQNRRCLQIRLVPSKEGERCSRSPPCVRYQMNMQRFQTLIEEEDYSYNCLFGYDVTHKIQRGWNSFTIWLGKDFDPTLQFSIRVVEFFTEAQLLEQLNTGGARSYADAKQRFWNEFERFRELQPADCYSFSVLDPYSGAPIERAVRFRDCQHVEAFDFHTFLVSNTDNPKMRCPYCPSTGPLSNLVDDVYFDELVHNCRAHGCSSFTICRDPEQTWIVHVEPGGDDDDDDDDQ